MGLVVLAAAVALEHGLDREYRRLRSLERQEDGTHRRVALANDLLFDLGFPHRGGGMEDMVLREWRVHLTDLIRPGQESTGELLPRGDLDRLDGILAEVDALLLRKPSRSDAGELSRRALRIVRTFAMHLGDALAVLREERMAAARAYDAKGTLAGVVLVLVAVGGAGLVVVLAGRFFLGISRDLRLLERRAEEIATGRYRGRIEIHRDDEIADLAVAMEAMATALAAREEERAGLQQRRLQDERMLLLGTLASGIAHQITNPLQSMLSVADTMAGSLSREAEAGENLRRLEAIIQQIEQLGHAVDQFRSLARPAPAKAENASLNSILESAIELVRVDSRFRRIEIRTDLDRYLPMVRVVPGHLTLLVIHLLNNAAEAINGQGGRITVATRIQGTRVGVVIEDDGRGVPGEVAARAFDPFFTTKPRGEGLGLGLAVCKTIIDRHHGALEIEGRVECGTRVRFWIPAAGRTEAA